MRVYRATRAIEPSHVDDGYWHRPPTSIDVYTDDTPRKTGLLNERGDPIMSYEIVGPIGFNRS